MRARPAGWLAAALGAAALLVAACSQPSTGRNVGGGGGTSASQIPLAPRFADELRGPSSTDWLTYGGDLSGQRYSTLNQITTSNVSRLGGVWRIHLGSGIGDRFSGEATPVEYGGVIYTTTGADDVFAIDVDSGQVLWTYHPGFDEQIKTLCCAWNNRGVAIGQGMVFIGQLDGKLVALDQRTGDVVWQTQLGDPDRGETITMAPLYDDGRVYIGMSGGEYGVRGRLTAIDAATGDEVWRFWTIPGPGQEGHETWPANDAWTTGGAVVWNTPALDPELGMLYLSTSNAGPLYDGSYRPGMNLFTSSIVALDLQTGALRWYFQEIHHDVWDYDATNPIVLFDATIDGQLRHGLAQANKDGFVYELDRETGKPLIGIAEEPVPTDPKDASWPTQPIPQGDAFVPQSIAPDEVSRLIHGVPVEWRYENQGKVFTPPTNAGAIAKPSTLGGANWPPSSFDPDTGYLYICASDTMSIFSTSDVEYRAQSVAEGAQFLGSAFAAPGGVPLYGRVVAMDVRSNTIAWADDWKTNGDNCYSGMLTTAGGLAFVGKNDGRLLALDARTGKQLWDYQTGAGANAPAITFERDGTQYVLQYSGGNAISGSTRGDILTLFALDGTLPPAASGQAQEHSGSGAQSG
jgi:quinohemoprotein ethanol dehydrogenase